MRIYVAGPVSGRPNFNQPQFEAARRLIEASGHVAVVPLDHTKDLRDCLCPALVWCVSLVRCLYLLEGCGAAVFLDGWRESRGASREWQRAEELGIPRFELRELLAEAGR